MPYQNDKHSSAGKNQGDDRVRYRSRSMTSAVTYSAILAALGLIFSYIEVLIPFNFGIPGIKLGIANLPCSFHNT